MTILDEIVASKRIEVDAARRRLPLDELEERASVAPPAGGFRTALAGPGPIRLIAEIKKASPSAQVIRADFDPIAIARTYQEHGASCLSVLTDTPYFQGHLAASGTGPGLSCNPVVTQGLLDRRLPGGRGSLSRRRRGSPNRRNPRRRHALSVAGAISSPGDGCIWSSSTTRPILPRVLAAGADLIGINNRDLRHFGTDLEHTLRLRDRIPPEVVVVSESGIRSRRDVERLEAAGVSAILVGESLMRAPDIGRALERLMGLAPRDEVDQ